MHSVIEAADSPWHEGELTIQRRVGVADLMEVVGRRNVRDYLVEQHRAFFPQLPFVVAGAVDPAGDAWATILSGRPGFLQSPDPETLRVKALAGASDPAAGGLRDGDSIGLLGIELHTRRRNRLNGRIRRSGADVFDVAVAQSFGNCPQYIQLRDFSFVRDPADAGGDPAQTLDRLDRRASAMIAAASTLFIASYVDREGGARQVDVSHRGGRPGFVHVGDDGVLTIPDFAGNQFFNTLGNILVNPRCGLLFVDFETGGLLQLTGDGEVILDAPEITAFQGAERLLRFTPRRIILRPGALPLRWISRAGGASPNASLTGDWAQARDRLRALERSSIWRPFQVVGIVEESSVIRSLHLEPADGAGPIPHQAGQHLPIRVAIPDAGEKTIRTYTISSAPSDGIYRISVKREGAISRFLHTLKVGDVFEARGPAGGFTIDAGATRPAVLLAAGIGITPLLAMLRHLVYEGLRTRRIRPTWLFHAARTKDERAFDREIDALEAAGEGAVRVVRILSDSAGAEEGDYDVYGRIDIRLLRATLPSGDHDFYLCGPGAFMQDLHDGLRDLGVGEERIHAEAFGPASFRQRPVAGQPPQALPAAAEGPVDVVFATSGRRARWTPASGTLLDLAEAEGLDPPFQCRAGSCGTCRARILAGAVTYKTPPTAEFADDEALICCATPAAATGEGAGLSLML